MKIRKVPGGFAAGIAKAGGNRNAPGGKNCHVNRSLSQYAGRPWTVQGTVNAAAWPYPKARSPASRLRTSTSGTPIAVRIRNTHKRTLGSIVLVTQGPLP